MKLSRCIAICAFLPCLAGAWEYDFESTDELRAWACNPGITTELADRGIGDPDGRSCRLTLAPGVPWHGMQLDNVPLTLLREYRWLAFELEAETPVDYFSLMIADGSGEFPVWFQSCWDRWTPGERLRVKIDLQDNDIVRYGSQCATLKLWGANRSNQPQSMLIDRMRLSGHGRAYRRALLTQRGIRAVMNRMPENLAAEARALEQQITDLLESRPTDAAPRSAAIADAWEEILARWAGGAALYSAPVGELFPAAEGVAALPFPEPHRAVELELARHEYESVFLVLKNGAEPLKQVSPQLRLPTDLEWEIRRVQEIDIGDADQFPGKRIQGTTPDALLPNAPEEIAPHALAYYLLTVYAPAETDAGSYNGVIEVAGAPAIPLQLRVRNFTLPVKSSLPTYFNTWSHNWENFYRYGERPEYKWLDDTDFTRIPTDEKVAFARTANRYRLGLAGMPEAQIHELHTGAVQVPVTGWEEYVRELAPVNGEAIAAYTGGATVNADLSDNVEKQNELREVLERVRAAAIPGLVWSCGLLDEPHRRGDRGGLAAVAREAKFIKSIWPECQTLLASGTAMVPTEGDYAAIDKVAMICDRTELKLAREQQQSGRQILWYSCNVVYGPNLSWSTFYDNKLMPRMMPILCYKYDLDGFLHWSTLLWGEDLSSPSNPKRWPEEPWNSRKSCWQAGEGYLFYPGNDGEMWPSLRLENWRAGMEDYEYLKLLEARKPRMSPSDRARAEALLQCDEVAQAPYEYATEAATVQAWRRAIADLIEAYE